MRKPSLRAVRRTVQCLVAVAFVVIPVLNHFHINAVCGNFLSFRAGFLVLADPLAVLQITLKNAYFSSELLVGAGIALLLAALLGTVFCSWICPYGLLSECVHGLASRRRPGRALRPGSRNRAFAVRLALIAAGLLAFLALSTTPVLNQLSMPAWYARFFQMWAEQGHISLAIVFLGAVLGLEYALGRRAWCRFVCPQSVLLTLAKLANRRRLRVVHDPAACTCKGDSPCVQACSMGLNPRLLRRGLETSCTTCGDCVNACASRGRALTWRMGESRLESKQT